MAMLRSPCRLYSKCVAYFGGSQIPSVRRICSSHSAWSLSNFSSARHSNKLAILDSERAYTYSELLQLSAELKDKLHAECRTSLIGERIAYITRNDAKYTICQWAIWLSGAIAVPLCPKHPNSEVEYVLRNAQANTVISAHQFDELGKELSRKLSIKHISLPKKMLRKEVVSVDELSSKNSFKDTSGLIIYTSGSTGRPKGVLHTISSLSAQVEDMVEAWKWKADDVALHVLPLHHVHGIVNLLLCPLSVGALVVMENEFDPKIVWKHLLQKTEPQINVFMAVPTIYAKLIEYFDENKMDIQETRNLCKKIRLMVSGSAALPVSLLERWRDLTGHTLLERYGMTEIGMALTNSYEGPRIPGSVGLPFPGVSVRIVPSDVNDKIDINNCAMRAEGNFVYETPGREKEQGNLLVKSASMFKGYWNNATETANSFIGGNDTLITSGKFTLSVSVTRPALVLLQVCETARITLPRILSQFEIKIQSINTESPDWFITGDTAVYENGAFRIVGRSSVDIIKSGGYKISALGIEQHLLNHPSIREVSVLGVPDPVWGQRVVAILNLKDEETLHYKDFREWCKDHMASYEIPKEMLVMEIPRNLMGKVNKKELLHKFFTNSE